MLGAEFRIKPSITISEEYTDNVFDSHLNRESDYITRAQPGISLQYQAPFWDWDLNYAYDYRYYARGSQKNDTTHHGNLHGLLKLVDEKLFLELSDSYQRVSLDVTRDTTNESLFQNQSDQNIGTVSPYLVLRPTAAIMIKTGYRYENIWYKDALAIDKQNHFLFLETSYEVTPKFFTTAGYIYSREESGTVGDNLSRHQAFLGPRYEYADKSFIFAHGGAFITKHSTGRETTKPFWNAGITHNFDTVTATLTSSSTYSEDPLGVATLEMAYAASIAKNFKRGTVTLLGSYSEFSDQTGDSLDTTRYSTGFTSTYELLQDLHGTLGLTYEHYDDVLQDTSTRKYALEAGLSYLIDQETSLGLNYLYTDYSSAQVVEDNKQVNRVILEARKGF